MTKLKYNVWCYVDNLLWCMLSHRNKTEFTFKTAISYAEEYATKHKTRCKVLHVDDKLPDDCINCAESLCERCNH